MTLGDLVIDIVKKLGVEHIFGVPGDYNLRFLDYIVDNDKLKWVGNCNELNASYAADGYARENGIGVLVTTLGVGELSAANGIAGSFAHNIPVLHIVGYPNSRVIEYDIPVHHTLANFKKNSFLESFTPISGATTILTATNYIEEIQRVVSTMLKTKKPVYLGIPTDLVDMDVSETMEDIYFYCKNGDAHMIKEIGDIIIKRYLVAKKPMFLLGVNIARFGWRDMMTKILLKNQAKFATTLMGKSIINETSVAKPNYLGIYAGDYSTKGMVKVMQDADCIVSVGTVETDINCGGFTEDGIDFDNVITIRPNSVKIGKTLYSGVSIDTLLEYILENITLNKKAKIDFEADEVEVRVEDFIDDKNRLNHKDFWPLVAKEIVKEGDIVVAEAGTALFGLVGQNLPPKVDFVSQLLWASIGYTLPSAIGSAIASPKRRVLLFIGDGSFQLTAQELSLIARYNLNITVFLINNNGYTIERAIHGAKQSYNDISTWKYLDLARSLGVEKTIKVENFKDFMANINNINETGPKMVELFFDKLDFPPLLKQISDKLEEANRQ
ncbi:MAG: thiamine pyrophosphate-binding protein [Sulfurospirillum sp.]